MKIIRNVLYAMLLVLSLYILVVYVLEIGTDRTLLEDETPGAVVPPDSLPVVADTTEVTPDSSRLAGVIDIPPPRVEKQKSQEKKNQGRQQRETTNNERAGMQNIDQVSSYTWKKEKFQVTLAAGIETGRRLLDVNKDQRLQAEDRFSTLFSRSTDNNSNIHFGEPKKDKYDELIALSAERWNIDPLFMKVLVEMESAFDPDAENPRSSATGLGQMLVGTYRLVFPEHETLTDGEIKHKLKNPRVALNAMGKYLAEYVYKTSSTPRQRFFSYYLGHQGIDYLIKPGSSARTMRYFPEATRYAERGVRLYEKYADLLGYTHSQD